MMQVGVGFTVSDSGTFRIPGPRRWPIVVPDGRADGLLATVRRRRARVARLLLAEPLLHHQKLAGLTVDERLSVVAAIERVCKQWVAAS